MAAAAAVSLGSPIACWGKAEEGETEEEDAGEGEEPEEEGAEEGKPCPWDARGSFCPMIFCRFLG